MNNSTESNFYAVGRSISICVQKQLVWFSYDICLFNLTRYILACNFYFKKMLATHNGSANEKIIVLDFLSGYFWLENLDSAAFIAYIKF